MFDAVTIGCIMTSACHIDSKNQKCEYHRADLHM
jgi:hypothetical protein